MYCFVSTPTGPRPLSADRIVMFAFCFICFRRFDWSRVRLGVVCLRLKFCSVEREKCWILLSSSTGGSGARHFDFPRRVFGSNESVGSSPAKYILRPMSRSNRAIKCSTSDGVMLMQGIGMNLSPRPSSSFADGGSFCVDVKS